MTIQFINNNLTQAFEEFNNLMLFTAIENIILFIFLSSAIFLIVSTPLALVAGIFDSFFKQRKLGKEIDACICCETKTTHKIYDNKICTSFVKQFSILSSSILALLVWMVSSGLYITLYFESASMGIMSYFKFPFDILSTYDFNNSILTLTSYQNNWYFMLGIFVVTVSSFVIGQQIAPSLIKKSITDKTEAYSFA